VELPYAIIMLMTGESRKDLQLDWDMRDTEYSQSRTRSRSWITAVDAQNEEYCAAKEKASQPLIKPHNNATANRGTIGACAQAGAEQARSKTWSLGY
jgi:hypothetical protein